MQDFKDLTTNTSPNILHLVILSGKIINFREGNFLCFQKHFIPDHSQALRGNAIGNASRHKNLNCSILFRQSEECLIFSSTLLH